MSNEVTTTSDSNEVLKETLTSNLKGMVGKADALLKQASHKVADDFATTRSIVSDKACDASNATQAYVRGNPWKVVGAAAVAGVLIGAFISNRRAP